MLDSIVLNSQLLDLIPNQVDRAIFMLYYDWGLTEKEIGHCFDIEERLVLKRLTWVRELLQRNLNQ
jgi:DNA-directed RNA polymerase specialized sigma24 family protein